MLNGSVESGHPCLVFDFRHYFSFSGIILVIHFRFNSWSPRKKILWGFDWDYIVSIQQITVYWHFSIYIYEIPLHLFWPSLIPFNNFFLIKELVHFKIYLYIPYIFLLLLLMVFLLNFILCLCQCLGLYLTFIYSFNANFLSHFMS